MEAWPKKEGARRERGWSMPRVHWWGCRQWCRGSRSRARAPCFSSGRKARGAGRRRSRRRGLRETVTRAMHTARSLARKPCVVPAADWGPGGQSMLEGIGTRCTVERAHGASSNCPGWNVRSYTCPSSHGARSIVRISGVRVPSGRTAHGPSSKVPQTHAPRCTVHRADAACAEMERAAWTLRGGDFGKKERGGTNLKKKVRTYYFF